MSIKCSAPIFNFDTWRFEMKYRFKPRLYITLSTRFAPPRTSRLEDNFRWGILLAPKTEFRGQTTGTCFQVKEDCAEGWPEWSFEEKEVPIDPNDDLLVRVMIGKVLDEAKVREWLRSVPIQDDQGWNSVAWVKDAVAGLRDESMERAMGRAVLDWEPIKREAITYVKERERNHRFDGTCDDKWDLTVVPTWCMLRDRAVCN